MPEVSIIANPPTQWEVTTLGEVCEESGGDIQTGPFGSQLHASDYVSVGIPSVMPVNIGDSRILTDGICRVTEADAQRLSRYRLRSGDIVYSRRGDVERLALVREREDGWLCGTGCLRVRFGKGKVDPLYASYYLGHPSVRQWVVQHAIGATMPNLNTGILSALPFLCPSLPEQKAIADILGSLDDKIELNRRINETLEEMARAVFKSWFVEFDPVHAKSKGRKPDGMDADTAKLFPSSFEESEIGRVPKGWKVRLASDVAEVGIGKTPPRKEHQWFSTMPTDIPWMSIRDLGEAGAFITHTSEFLTPAAVEKFRVRRIPDGTVVLSFKLTIGRVAITDGEMLSNEAIAHFLLKPSTPLNSVYLYCYLKGFAYDQLGSTSSIATAINSDMVRQIKVLVPPKDITTAFEAFTNPFFDQIKAVTRQSSTLVTTRNALLPRLLSGELAVPTSKVV